MTSYTAWRPTILNKRKSILAKEHICRLAKIRRGRWFTRHVVRFFFRLAFHTRVPQIAWRSHAHHPKYNGQVPKRLISLFFLIGGVISGAAVLAETLGLDNDPGWGIGRFALLLIGLLIICIPVIFTPWGKNFIAKYGAPALDFFEQFRQSSLRQLKSNQIYWFSLPVFIFVILVYIWFASSGTWTHWDSPTRYYAEQARSFEKGILHLQIKPDPGLLQLSNPYDPPARGDVDFLIDASLYNGKYYLYWGPAPALLLVLINPFVQSKVGDLQLAFLFLSGTFFAQYLLMTTVWDRIFNDQPRWTLIVPMLVAGLCIPSTFILVNEPNGRIYEASIAGGQFFLLWGFLISLRTAHSPVPSNVRLALTGTLWSLALGTRLTLILSVIFSTVWLGSQILSMIQLPFIDRVKKLVSLGLPLFLCVLLLGWYNWFRFGSVTETGYSYQLAGVNLQKYRGDLFSPAYVVQNLYNYFLHPPGSRSEFPFLYPTKGKEENIVSIYPLPDVYQTNPITGLLLTFPFVLFSAVPLIAMGRRSIATVQPETGSFNVDSAHSLNSILTGLFIMFSSALFLLAVFFWAAMRYMVDFIPSITLISSIGFWQGYQLLAKKPAWRKLYSMSGIFLGCATVIISQLVAIALIYSRY